MAHNVLRLYGMNVLGGTYQYDYKLYCTLHITKCRIKANHSLVVAWGSVYM